MTDRELKPCQHCGGSAFRVNIKTEGLLTKTAWDTWLCYDCYEEFKSMIAAFIFENAGTGERDE
jgi:hypothetical protein